MVDEFYCGDSFTEFGTGDEVTGPMTEGCDDGNALDGDGCSSSCEIEPPLTGQFEGSCVSVGRDADTGIGRLPSVNDDEYFPIWWQLEYTDSVWEANNNCNAALGAGQPILADGMTCDFGIYQGSAT